MQPCGKDSETIDGVSTGVRVIRPFLEVLEGFNQHLPECVRVHRDPFFVTHLVDIQHPDIEISFEGCYPIFQHFHAFNWRMAIETFRHRSPLCV